VACLLAGLSLMPLRGFAQAPVFRGAVDLVPVAVTVVDRRGAAVTGLTADDFEVSEDGRRQTVSYFATGDTALTPALHLGVLLDFSESMIDDVAFTRTASIKFLNMLVHAVDVTVVDFDRCHRRRGRRRVGARGTQGHAALHRRRRYPQLAQSSRSDEGVAGV
jgi:hypothetical protein